MTTDKITTEGAEIFYERVGKGPVLVTIAGGGGASADFARLAPFLADEFTVVSYDRRCRSRSTGDKGANLDMAQQARDAAAIIAATSDGPAFVMGNSGGANIALKLAEDHPAVIKGVVVHEPPVSSILPDGAERLAFLDTVQAAIERGDVLAARKMFMDSFVGFDGPAAIGQQMAPADAMFFMTREFKNLSHYKPDLERLRRNKVPMATGAGKKSADAYYARTARLLAQELPCRYVEFPGHHVAFIAEPEAFAAVLSATLRGFA